MRIQWIQFSWQSHGSYEKLNSVFQTHRRAWKMPLQFRNHKKERKLHLNVGILQNNNDNF